MVLNIFPRRREPASAPAPATELALPEPSPQAMAEIEPPLTAELAADGTEPKRKTRRGSRGGRRRRDTGAPATEGEATEAVAEAAVEPAPEAPAPEAKPRAPRRPRTRAAAPAETTEAEAAEAEASLAIVEAAEAPAPAPSRSRRRKPAAEAEAAPAAPEVPAVEEAPKPAPRSRAKATPPAPAATAAASAEATAPAILRAVEQQQKQIDQLVRLHEDLARRVGSGGSMAAAAPPARVGIFVDAANIELACDRLRARFDWKKVLDLVTKDRVLVRAIAYSPVHDDPGVSIETQRFVEPFLDKGFKVVTKPLKRFSDGTIKANVDIELALDVIEMIDRLDVVVLVSGDGDFQRLVEVLQAKGIRVEVASVSASTASNLRHAADRFIDLQARLREIRLG